MEEKNGSTNPMNKTNATANAEELNQGEDQVYGSWMVVKRNTKSKTYFRQQIRGEKGKKSAQIFTQPQGAKDQKNTSSNGSRFAIFERAVV